MNRYLLVLIGLFYSIVLMAVDVKGVIKDKTSGEPLVSATVGIKAKDAETRYEASDLKGEFRFKNLEAGQYTLTISYVGYKTYERQIKLKEGKDESLNIKMEEDARVLGDLAVRGRSTRAEQKEDTLSYNAEAFKVMQGGNVEDLLSKMPGIVVSNGSVQAQGEKVKKVLVDGKEFFDGDVNLALKNLPADIISNIEVFDKKTDQAEFTGFDDGEQIKTINVVTKNGFREGTFGEVYGGYGTDNRYKAGGSVNFFNGNRRISILGLSNNINQQNFSSEDLAGVMSSGMRGRGGYGGGRGMMMGGMGMMGMGSSSNFMVGNQGGVTSSNGFGLNYVDQLTKKLKFTGSYFFNQSNNTSETSLDRQYFESVLPGATYREYSLAKMENWNHRINMRLDYNIDRNNMLQIRPRISFQNNNMKQNLSGVNTLNDSKSNSIENKMNSDSKAYNLGADILYNHRFKAPGRTLSTIFSGNVSNKTGETYSDYVNQIFHPETKEELYGQFKDLNEKQYSVRGNLMYSERLLDPLQLQVSYKISYSNSDADRKVYAQSPITDLYDQLEENLSNDYQTDYITQAGGLSLRYHKGRWSMNLGADFQYASLSGDQKYPFQEEISKNFFSVLPSFFARYSINRSNSFMFRYRSNSMAPSLSSLQEVVDNTNPLFLSSGNPDLDQQISHSLNLRYVHTAKTGQTFIAMLGATLRSNYISDSTFVATENITLPSGIEMEKGAQFRKPINMNGYYTLQSMVTYGFPIDFLRSNLNFSLSANYSNVPTMFNGETSKTRELNLIPKVILGSNISNNLDFTLSYSASYNKMSNTLSDARNSDYFNHTAAAKIGWTFWKGFTLRSSFNYTNFAGLEGGSSDYFLWNASLGKKFLKNNQAEIRLEAFDLLNQNKAFSHRTGSNYYDYVNTNVIKPYAMLSFVYTIR